MSSSSNIFYSLIIFFIFFLNNVFYKYDLGLSILYNCLSFLISLVSGFKNIQTENALSLSIRASALFGNVVPFFDMARHLNYIGEGMNEAARILSGGQKVLEEMYLSEHPGALYGDEKKYSRNSLFLGDSLAESIEEYKEDCTNLLRFADVADKHGKKRNVTVLQGIL